MKFKKLAEYFEKIEATTSRLTITEHLAALFQKLSTQEIDKTVYLLQGRVLPSYTGVEFGMAEKMIIKSIISAMQLDEKLFQQEFKKRGDIGSTVEHFKKQFSSIEEKELDIVHVYKDLYTLATTSGEGSTAKKISILSHLISQVDALSSRYLVRMPLGVMRLGFSDMTVLDAFSWMLTGNKTLRGRIEQGYHVRPDLGFIGKTLKEGGVKAMNSIKPVLFTPIIMMRAERLTSGEEIIKKIGECAIESKYDGFRLQAHYDKKGGKVRLYSRSLDDVSFMYPDVIEGLKKEVKADKVILEGEAIGFDPKRKKFLPFQETVQRKRKYDIEAKSKEIPLKFFVFELLYLDGTSYIEKPFQVRREKLKNCIVNSGQPEKHTLLLSPQQVVKDPTIVEDLFDISKQKGFEGIVAKKLDGIYQAGARGWSWIKLKKSYATHVADTIDCLVMGYDSGRGKRVGFGIGAFLVGVYNEKDEVYETVSKIGTGLTDIEWKKMYELCQKYKTPKKPAQYEVDKAMEVDTWITPKIVVEIRADEITRSSMHTAGRKMKASKSGSAYVVDQAGFALRFPRLEKFRPDKKPEDATTIQEVEKLYKLQTKA